MEWWLEGVSKEARAENSHSLKSFLPQEPNYFIVSISGNMITKISLCDGEGKIRLC